MGVVVFGRSCVILASAGCCRMVFGAKEFVLERFSMSSGRRNLSRSELCCVWSDSAGVRAVFPWFGAIGCEPERYSHDLER